MADINVLMMGGKRAGKTSVLAAMDKCSNKLLSMVDDLDLDISCAEGGGSLQVKKNELKTYFNPPYTDNNEFTADLNPTCVSDTYVYDVDVNSRDSGYTLNFTDIPGEWLEQSDRQDELQKLVDISQIIIITIDTPHMVERKEEATGFGEYHLEFNRVAEVTRFLKKAFQQSKQERMVLFVPLKCEKYYYRNKMEMVNKTVKKGYNELLGFLANDEIQELCTVAIVPILTIGGAEFYKFNNNGYAGIYSYVEDEALKEYNPKYCEQPLFFTLYYLIKMAERNKLQQWKISTWFKETFKNAAKLANLVDCKKTLEGLIETDKSLGFEIIQNPLGMEVK